MKTRLHCILFAFLCSGMLACSAKDIDNTASGKITGDASNPVKSVVSAGCGYMSCIQVDAIFGDDLTGSRKPPKPFKTLTMGLAAAKANDTVIVAGGTYDDSNGEIFPLKVKTGVRIEAQSGDQDAIHGPAIISGSGLYTSSSQSQGCAVALVLEGSDTSVKGFQINSEDGVAVWVEDGSNSAILDNTLSLSDYGLIIAGNGNDSLQISDNEVSRNRYSGIEVLVGAPVLQNNIIKNNGTGVVARNNANPNLGSMSQGGENTIQNNAGCGFQNDSSNNIYAIGNTWNDDKTPFFASSSCTNEVDIANTYTGATTFQDIPVTGDPIFPGTKSINAISPARGDILHTTTPSFNWEQSGTDLVMVGLFKKRIEVDNDSVNTDDLFWVWYPGLKKGTAGSVGYYEGVNVEKGDLSTASRPVPLEQGRTYYWAVWSWNEEGTLISNSSMDMYFTTSNY